MISCFMMCIMVLSFYMGVCLYINGMVADMKANLTDSTLHARGSNTEDAAIWRSIIRKEIDFHNEIRT